MLIFCSFLKFSNSLLPLSCKRSETRWNTLRHCNQNHQSLLRHQHSNMFSNHAWRYQLFHRLYTSFGGSNVLITGTGILFVLQACIAAWRTSQSSSCNQRFIVLRLILLTLLFFIVYTLSNLNENNNHEND